MFSPFFSYYIFDNFYLLQGRIQDLNEGVLDLFRNKKIQKTRALKSLDLEGIVMAYPPPESESYWTPP